MTNVTPIGKRNAPVATFEHTDELEDWATSTDRVPVFAVRRRRPDYDPEAGTAEGSEPDDGYELVTYTMPAKPRPGLALRFLKMARTMGDAASSWLIETAIGEEGYDALTEELDNYQGDAQALLQSIMQRIQTVAMGGLDGGPKA